MVVCRLRVEREVLRIRKVPPASEVTGSPWLAERYRRFAPVRQEVIEEGHTEEEIDAAIARAVGGVQGKGVEGFEVRTSGAGLADVDHAGASAGQRLAVPVAVGVADGKAVVVQ